MSDEQWTWSPSNLNFSLPTLSAHGQTKPPAWQFLQTGGRLPGTRDSGLMTRDSELCLNDPRRNKEDQFLIRRVHLRVLEQVAK